MIKRFLGFLAFLFIFSTIASAQFVDRITRPCPALPRALVITNPSGSGNVEVTTCTGGALTVNGTPVVPGGAVINPTNGVIPYRSNSTTFSDSPFTRTSATVITSSADLRFTLDNTKDIGASGATRPRNGFFGTSLTSPVYISGAANPADAGAIRLGNTELIEWEKFVPGTDWTLGVDAGDILQSSAPVGAPSVKLNGSVSGTLTVQAAATAGANTLTLPAGTTDFSATGGASQFVKQASAGAALTVIRPVCADLSDAGAGCSGSGATPGGSNTQVQYNNAGAFGGISGVTTNGTNLTGTVVDTGATTTGPDFEVAINGDTNSRVAIGINTTDVPRLSFGPGNAVRDLFLERAGAANLRFGAPDAAAPVAQNLSVQNVVAGTSNTAGANWTFKGSQGTGTGVGGSFIFQVAPAGSTGTAVNALATALTIDSTKTLTTEGPLIVKYAGTANNTVTVSSAGTVAGVTSGGGTKWQIVTADSGESLRMMNTFKIQFNQGANLNTAILDTTISRNAAGIVQFGTTTANALGTVLAANLNANTSLQFGGTVAYSAGTPGIAGNATLNTGSKDSAGKITSTGTGASTAVLTFSITFTNPPACFVTNETTSNLVRPVSTTTTLTINATVVTGDSISYTCLGY